MSLSRKSIVNTLVFVSIVLLISTLITAGAIACESLVKSVGKNSEQINSENVANPLQADCYSSAGCELQNCDPIANNQPQNYKSLSDYQSKKRSPFADYLQASSGNTVYYDQTNCNDIFCSTICNGNSCNTMCNASRGKTCGGTSFNTFSGTSCNTMCNGKSGSKTCSGTSCSITSNALTSDSVYITDLNFGLKDDPNQEYVKITNKGTTAVE